MEFYLEELGQGSRIIWQGFYLFICPKLSTTNERRCECLLI